MTVIPRLFVLFTDVAYVTFNKASEAALAIEQMNAKTMEGCPRPLKVCILLLYGMFLISNHHI